jgi:hypothetical protein
MPQIASVAPEYQQRIAAPDRQQHRIGLRQGQIAAYAG